MLSAEEATKKVMKDLENDKFKRPKVPNPPPYYNGDEKENEKILENSSKFLKSNLAKSIMELK